MRGNGSQRAVQNITLDPGKYDAFLTSDSGGVYTDNVAIDLNTRFQNNDTTRRFGLTWAAYVFDTLLDINTLSGYPYAITPVHLDSVDVWFYHTHRTGTASPDTIIFTIYQYTGNLGVVVNFSDPREPIANPTTIYADTIITTTSLAPPNQFTLYTFYPDTAITGNKKFVLAVHFYGDTLNEFGIRVGYGDRCGETCVAYPSINKDNLIWRMVHWQRPPGMPPQDFTGVWTNNSFSLYYDCNDDNIYPQREGCEYLFIQDLWATAYLTINPSLYAYTSPNTSICPGSTVNLSVTPIGGVGPYSVSWQPQTGLTNPFTAVTDAIVDVTTTYTATITDSDPNGPNVITRSITITVNRITIDAGADQTISCGQTANLVATPGGVLTNATFLWSNGKNTLNNPVKEAGTYTITATNIHGCTASDAVVVTLQGLNQTLSFTVDAPANTACVGQTLAFTNTSSSQGSEWHWQWSFGDGSLNTASSPSYAYSQAGTYTVTFSAYTLSGSDTCRVAPVTKTLTIRAANHPSCATIGVESVLSQSVELYPNPAEGVFTIDFSNAGSHSAVISIFDINGKKMLEETLKARPSPQRTFDLSRAANGIYFVKIRLDDEVVTKKLSLNR